MAGITAVTMPKWGLAMTEGLVAGWSVEEGQRIEPGTELLEIETAKITNALEAPAGGILRRRLAEAGQTLPVGALLGVIAGAEVPDSDIDAFVARAQAEAAEVAAAATASAPEPQTVHVDGQAMRYLGLGASGGTPILFVHGFGGDLNNWLFNMPGLAERYAVTAVDLPGHGGSAKQVGDGTIEAMADRLAGFVTATGIGRAHLVGHSMGGAVVTALALKHPRMAASLTLIGSAGLGPEIDSAYIEAFIAAQRRKDLKPQLEKLFGDPSLVTNDLVEDVLKYKRLDGVDAALRTIARAFVTDGRQATLLRDRLGEIGVPIQVIWGAGDVIIPANHVEGLPDNVDVHVLPDRGHMVHMEAAAEVNRLIERFAAKS